MFAFVLAAMLAFDPVKGLHYDIKVNLEPEMRQMTVESTVSVPAGTTADPEVPIVLNEQMGVPVLELNGTVIKPLREVKSEATLGNRIARYVAIDPTKDNTIKATYTTVDNTGFVYLINKYASFASGSNTSWYPSTGGRVVSSTISVNVPKGQVVKATGELVKTEQIGDRTVFTFSNPAAATLSFAAGPYVVIRDDTGKLPVALYLFKDRDWTKKAIEMLRQIADTLEDWFGPYPFSEMAIVEVQPIADLVAGFSGASLEGFILATPYYIDGVGGGPNLAFIGHELGHSWWGHQVKHAGGEGNYMITEALAQFGALKAVEAIDGAAGAREFRTTGYPGYIPAQSGQGALKTMKGGYDPLLSELSGAKAHGFSDGKGFQIYHQLEQVVGTAKLKSAFKQIQKSNAWQRINSDSMFEQFSKSTGTDLSWFYEQWFKRSGAPQWDMSWNQKGASLNVTIKQSGSPYRFVTEVEALMKDGTSRRWTVTVADLETKLQLPIVGSVQAVVFDPDWDVFHWDPELVEID